MKHPVTETFEEVFIEPWVNEAARREARQQRLAEDVYPMDWRSHMNRRSGTSRT